jgi:formylglycine-generating enzyme required for sulfatase activity
MGSDPKRDSQAEDCEKPQHRVTPAAFQIGRYPVTVAEYACFVRAGHAAPQRGTYRPITWDDQLKRLDHPVVCVTWHDAVAYAAWLAKLTGQSWRLPTEAEWEKAARGTDGRIYPWGDAFDKARCNVSESGIGTTTPVGSYPNGASPYGAQDMAGSVWEWASSLFKPYP